MKCLKQYEKIWFAFLIEVDEVLDIFEWKLRGFSTFQRFLE